MELLMKTVITTLLMFFLVSCKTSSSSPNEADVKGGTLVIPQNGGKGVCAIYTGNTPQALLLAACVDNEKSDKYARADRLLIDRDLCEQTKEDLNDEAILFKKVLPMNSQSKSLAEKIARSRAMFKVTKFYPQALGCEDRSIALKISDED
jgi:hypothetical protein